MILKLVKFNSWIAFACGVFSLMVAPMIVNSALISQGVRPQQIIQNETYLVAASFVRIAGIMFLAYAIVIWLLIKQNYDLVEPKSIFTLFAVGILVWAGMFIFVLPTKNAILAAVVGVGLLEWLAVPVISLFSGKMR